jgi:hypothetical protein
VTDVENGFRPWSVGKPAHIASGQPDGRTDVGSRSVNVHVYSGLWEVMASAMAISKPAKMTPQKIARGKARMQASKVSTG